MSTEINIKPDMFTWAIARAGYSLQEFFTKFPKVESWINNTKKPTIAQLEDFAKRVHLPFGYLFLSEPVKEEFPVAFFRSNVAQQGNPSINIFDSISAARMRQEWLSDYLQDEGYEKLPFVGQFENEKNLQTIVEDIRRRLQLNANWARMCATWEDALNVLVERIEELGIITIFNGVVENNTSRPLSVDECRGFILVDDYAPFMFINNADAKAAQLFTIVHELAHVWVGKSAAFDISQLQPANDPIEQLCDSVAAEFLVPQNSFVFEWAITQDFNRLAKIFKVSQIVIARRALDLGVITRKTFFEFYNNYIQLNIEKKANQAGGGDFYLTSRKRISMAFAAHVNNAVRTGKIPYLEAYKLTGLKGDTFHTFFSKYF